MQGSNTLSPTFLRKKAAARFLSFTKILATAIAVGLAMCSMIAHAQSGAGSIQGTVTDSTGAVISGASIHVVEQATNAMSDTKSNNVGFYQVPDLFTGTYIVTITAPGMKSYKTTVELQVAQAATINPTMTAGAVTQQVEVAANVAQLITTDSGTLASTLESERLNQLPMNGRMLLTLTGETTPGLEAGGTRANGLMPEALEYVADGVPLTNRNFGGEGNSTQAQLPDPDAVQEVRTETTDTGAMYSSPATSIITTKSGTNRLHGSLFETARNNAIGIAKGRQNPSNFAAPPLVRNEFGASAGGPIVLPHVYHGKDKSFWFFAYERYSLAQQASQLVSVPTTAMRGGDFSALIPTSGVVPTLYDPSTTAPSNNCNGTGTANPACRSQFDYLGTQNRINPALLAPATKILYDITPLPNISGVTNPLQAANLNFPNDTYVVIPTITFRLDHNFDEVNKAYLRYTWNNQLNQALRNYPSASADTIAADGFPNGASGYQDINVANFGAALGYTHVFSPTFFAETILSQNWLMQYVGGGGNPKLDYESILGLPNNFGEAGFPVIGSNLIMPYGGTQYQYQENQIISNIDENLTKTIGKHQMQFGGRYRHERFGYLPDRSADQVTFAAGETTGLLDPSTVASNTDSALPNTGYQDADFFLGGAASYSVTQEPPYIHFHDMEFDGYFQGNWHVSRNLTANIGLRYEAHPAPWIKNGLMENFDLKNDAVVLTNPISYYVANGYTTQTIVNNLENLGVKFETPSQAGFPSAGIENADFTLGPRLGLAYQPFGGRHGTVIRAGYGRYIYPVPVRNFERDSVINQPFVAGYSQSYTAANQSPDGLPNYLLRHPQSVVMGTNSSGVVNSSTVNAILPGFSLLSINPDDKPDFVTQTNFTVEQSFKDSSALRMTWLWSHGTNLDHYYNYNNHPSQYVWEVNTGTALPTGGASVIGTSQQNTYAATATGPYDQTTYGGNTLITKDGWSNDNALQVNYQRLFHRGVAYQITYVWSKAFRVGGNTFRDGQVDTAQGNYATGSLGTVSSPYGTLTPGLLPPARPANTPPYADWHQLAVFEEYQVDTAIPKQHIAFNGIVDLPFGRGKRLLGKSNRVLDELVGGWQLAGDGSIASQDFAVNSSNWGPTNPLKIYKHSAPITDCRSGTCHKSFLWFNGYIPPSANANAGCTAKCVSGLPANYAPYQTPIDNTPGTKYYGQNEVNVTLANGQVVPTPYSPGPFGANPFSHTILNGPINWTVDSSLFKVFPITEGVNLRFNLDAFNAFNVQGYNNPSAIDGTEAIAPQVASSYNTPRQLQFTLRLTF